MDTTPVIAERTFNASASEIWNALTDNEKLRQWYFQLPDFRAEPGFKFTFKGGPDEDRQYVHRCEIVDVIPEKKLSYTWIYEGIPGNSLVTVELFSQDDGTKLTLTHTGLETIEPAGPDFAKSNFKEGWNYFVNTALKDFIENNNQ